ncbi:putative Bgh-specific protein [Blumeria hordei DH14]|uniref:Putative Bgh-specific protein n=1 Tax=Blumeria graminis f. sp. hordei (strain DH14) TaxID=546991 RepID=N1JGY9_BLUG1|nr:putative Bgh-specific protein [Blumeria hordei DH14]
MRHSVPWDENPIPRDSKDGAGRSVSTSSRTPSIFSTTPELSTAMISAETEIYTYKPEDEPRRASYYSESISSKKLSVGGDATKIHGDNPLHIPLWKDREQTEDSSNNEKKASKKNRKSGPESIIFSHSNFLSKATTSIMTSLKSPLRKKSHDNIPISSPMLDKIDNSHDFYGSRNPSMPSSPARNLKEPAFPVTSRKNSKNLDPADALPLRSFQSNSNPSSPHTQVAFMENSNQLGLPRSGDFDTVGSASSTLCSPYLPTTHATPVTPRMMSRSEIKAQKKLEAKKPITDMVMRDEDLW